VNGATDAQQCLELFKRFQKERLPKEKATAKVFTVDCPAAPMQCEGGCTDRTILSQVSSHGLVDKMYNSGLGVGNSNPGKTDQ